MVNSNFVDSYSDQSAKATVSYEPSYGSFEVNRMHLTENQGLNNGRRIFGAFVTDIDVCFHSELAFVTWQELIKTTTDDQDHEEENDLPDTSSSRIQKERTRVEKQNNWGKRPRAEGSLGGNRNNKKPKKKNQPQT